MTISSYSQSKRHDRWARAVVAFALAFLLSVPAFWYPAVAATEGPEVVAVQTTPDSHVSMVIRVPGGLVSEDLSISVDGSTVTPTVVPMMSRDLSVALVIDAAVETPAELVEAVQTGATDFLLSPLVPR